MLIKKSFIKICSIFLAAAFITGCSGKTTDSAGNSGSINDKTEYEEDGETFISKETGLVFNIPEEYQEKGIEIERAGEDAEGHATIGIMWYYRPVTDKIFTDMKEYSDGDYTDEMVQDFWDKMNIHSKYLMEIFLVKEQEYKEIKTGKSGTASLAGAEELGTNGGYIYLATTPENNTDGMSEEEKAQYEECMDYMETLKENLEFTDIEKNAGLPDKMPSFTTKDIKGNTVTDDIFKEKDLTVVNIWGTFCGPCIEEMPELAEWEKSMPDNVQLIGLVCDIEGESDSTHKELAAEIIEKAGAGFTNIIPDSSFDSLLKWVTGVPTTIFVDREGNITGEPVIGTDVDSYKKFVKDYINGK